MFIANLDGHIVEANPAACQMYGYSHQEFIGLPTAATIHPDYFPLIEESLSIIQSGGQVPNQLVAIRKDGTTFPVEARGTAFTYMGKPHILGIARDITERVEAEQQLREKEKQYRSIFEATDDGLIIWDLIQLPRFRATWACTRCASASPSWAGRFGSRVRRGLEPVSACAFQVVYKQNMPQRGNAR